MPCVYAQTELRQLYKFGIRPEHTLDPETRYWLLDSHPWHSPTTLSLQHYNGHHHGESNEVSNYN